MLASQATKPHIHNRIASALTLRRPFTNEVLNP